MCASGVLQQSPCGREWGDRGDGEGGVLGDKVKVCLEGDDEGETFPPSLKTPSPEEYVEVRREHLMQQTKS